MSKVQFVWQLALSFLILVSASEFSYGSCKQQEEEVNSGKFKVVSKDEVKVSCVLNTDGLRATEIGQVKAQGCKIILQNKDGKLFSVYGNGLDCALKDGSTINKEIRTRKNACCAKRSELGPLKPTCKRKTTVELDIGLSALQSMCFSGLEWELP